MSDYKTPSKYVIAQSSGGGRPKLIISEEGKQMVETLASFMCTDEEIATTFGVSVDVLTNKNNKDTFTEYKEKGQAKAKLSLRRSQFRLAEHNASMAIFLGKNYLGQTDRTEVVDDYAYDKLDTILKEVKNNAINEQTE